MPPPVVKFEGWHRDPDPVYLDRVIVTGYRKHRGRALIWSGLDKVRARLGVFLLVDGMCPDGVDQLSHEWAIAHGNPQERHAAHWDDCGPTCPGGQRHRRIKPPGDIFHPGKLDDYCPSAGPRRNVRMARGGAVVCLAAPVGVSLGTRGCMRIVERFKIPVTSFEDPKW